VAAAPAPEAKAEPKPEPQGTPTFEHESANAVTKVSTPPAAQVQSAPPKTAEVVTISSLAGAFDPLQTESKSGGAAASPKKRKKKDAEPDKPKEAWVSKRKSDADKPATKKQARDDDAPGSAANKEPAADSDNETSKGPALAAAMQVGQAGQAAKRPAPGQPRREGAKAAVALTEAQLQALRNMRAHNDDTRQRWVELLLLLLFLLMLQFGVPLLSEAKHAQAQALFGARTPLVAGAFAMVSVIAMVRAWGARVTARVPLMGAVCYVMQIVTLCVCVLCAAMFMPDHSFGILEFGMRRALPWAASLLFLVFGLVGTIRGAKDIAQNLIYALVLLSLSTGSLYGSYRVVTKSVQLAAAESSAERARRKKAQDEDPDSKPAPADLLDGTAGPGTPPKSVDGLLDQLKGATAEQPAGTVSVGQRKEVGGSEAEDLKTTDGLESSRKANGAVLNKLSGALGSQIK
jgi:hypothetical protein